MPACLRLPDQNRLVTVEEATVFDAEVFTLNLSLLAERMGGHVDKPGFSEGYYTLHANGKTYSFSKTQAEILEILDKGGRLYKHEIMAKTSSRQDSLKNVFRSNGKYHEAWGVVVKNDRKGNYWLEY